MGIPFAYPPLIPTLAILAFYWTCSIVLSSRSTAALSTVAYALMPRSFSWYIMGGGLSRSFGVLFLMLICGSAWLLFARPAWKRLMLTAAFGAGAVLSHPETGLHTLAACVLIWLFRGRTRTGTRSAFLVALGVAMLTALGLIGLVAQGLRWVWFLPVWVLAAFDVEPSSATAIAALPLAMLAGVGLGEFVLPNIGRMTNGQVATPADRLSAMSGSRTARIVVAYIVFMAFLGAFAYDLTLAGFVVSPSAREAMTWIRQNTLPGSRFVRLWQPRSILRPTG